jgi:hypothetical protein
MVDTVRYNASVVCLTRLHNDSIAPPSQWDIGIIVNHTLHYAHNNSVDRMWANVHKWHKIRINNGSVATRTWINDTRVALPSRDDS